jgi:hypothetical protein
LTDKHIRISVPAWKKLRTLAFNGESHIKTVLDEIIIDGTRDPLTGKMI